MTKIKVRALVDIEHFKKGQEFEMKEVLYSQFKDKVEIITEKKTKEVKKGKNKAILSNKNTK